MKKIAETSLLLYSICGTNSQCWSKRVVAKTQLTSSLAKEEHNVSTVVKGLTNKGAVPRWQLSGPAEVSFRDSPTFYNNSFTWVNR